MRFALTALFAALVAAHAAAHETHDGGHGHETEDGGRVFQVLKGMPTGPEAYQPHAAELVKAGIPEKYGETEWAAVVLAHELHQHIGIMTVVGAKMAVRAGELLDAPGRAVNVVMETGPEPPFSCAVDGVQAGLGSTYAQQLIAAPKTDAPKLAGTFTHEGRTVRLSLKPEYAARIRGIIQSAIEEHGNLTPAYFDAIQHASYYVWANFDRKEVFAQKWLEQSGGDEEPAAGPGDE
jgi:hypothetical protein